MSHTLNILVLAPYPPYPPRSGGALRIYNLLSGLARQHHVTCLTFAPNAAAVAALEPLRASCRVVAVWDMPRRGLLQRTWTTLASPLPDVVLRNLSPTYTAALRWLLDAQPFDIVQAESIEMARYGLLARSSGAQAASSVRLVLDQFNAEYVLQKRAAQTDLAGIPRPRALVASAYSLIQWRKLAMHERYMLQHYNHVLAVSEEDRRALLRLEPDAQVAIVPNGVDTNYFQPQAAADQNAPRSIVFTGTLDFRPNVDAVLWFVRHVLPLVRASYPDTCLVLVGRSPSPAVRALHDGATIIVQPDVADVRPFIAAAAVYVVPMRMGGGVRLKLLEALAMQSAIVSTTMGAEGVPELRDGEHLLLADTAQAFAGAISRLLDHPDQRQKLGTAGRAMVTTHYDWRVIAPRLEAVYTAE